MNAFTIKDLENLSGIKAHTIRIWEQRYNFLKPQRTSTNIRCYCNDELKTLLNVALLNKYGFKISHIDRMQPQEIKDRILLLDEANAVQERIINDLVQEMVDLDMGQFEKIIATYIAARGIERTIMQVIFPFLERIGILWQTGNINPAQEHLVSNIIRQKLIAAIEMAESTTIVPKTFLLFLPEGEHHELGLLFIYYLLKIRGAGILYLGANVPLKDAAYVITLKKPDIAFTHLTAPDSHFNLGKFLNTAHQSFSNTPVVVSGNLIQHYRKSPPDGFHFKKSLPEVMEYFFSL